MTRSLIIAVLLMLYITACGSVESVNQGDTFEVLTDLRETATVQMGTATDGFTKIIPKGTKLKALFSTTPAASYFECAPVEVNGSSDADDIEVFFVPEGMRMSEEYQGFSYSFPIEYIGDKLKRVN